MALDCEKFAKRVPANTLKFLYAILPDLKFYVSKKNTLKVGSSYSITDVNIKIALLLTKGLKNIEEYNNLFGILQMRDFSFKNKESEDKKNFDGFKQFYDEYTYLFDLFDDEIDYASLTPLKLTYHHLKKLSSYDRELFCSVTGTKKDAVDKIKDLVAEESNKLSEEIKAKVSENKPIQIISYLECASKIREELFNNQSRLNKEYFSSIDDINAVSLFLSLYFYDDIKSNDRFFVSERDIMMKILKDAGIDLEGIKRVTGLSINSANIASHEANYFVIDEVYEEYTDSYSKRLVTNYIYDIVKNVLNRNNSNSIALEKIFLRLNCYLNMINLSKDAFVQATEEEKLRIINEYTKTFYADLSWQVREFINFTAKAYSLIMQLVKKNRINNSLVQTEDDADTLALYIASHFYDGDVDEFFTNNSVSYEKVSNLLGIKITKKDIEDMPLDVDALIVRFKRYVYEGVNSRKNSKNLAIKDIIHNLCNKKFNRSSIMNDLFESLSDGKVELEEDFLSQLNKYFEDRDKAMKEEMKVELFHDMPLDTVNYLDNVSGIYSSLGECTEFQGKDRICFSLLLAVFIKDRSEICKFFNHIGLENKGVLSTLGISTSGKWDDPNVEVLKNAFEEYIFGGVNKELKREDITVKQIVKNIFNKDLNDSFYMKKLLNTFDLSYETFDNFDTLYDKTLSEVKLEEKRESIERKISNKTYDTTNYIKYTLRIFNELKRGSSNGMLNAEIINDDNDLVELSLVLAALAYPNNASKFFTKYEMTFERICEYCGIDPYVLLDIAKGEAYNAFDLTDYFAQYMVGKNERLNDLDNIVNNIFDERLNNSLVLENICNNFGISYLILKREVLSKMDYEASLSIEERTNLLLNEEVDVIVPSDRKSFLRYGNDLGSHSKYIFDELPRLQLNDTNDSSVAEITSSLSNLYLTVEAKRKGIFSIFSRKEDNGVKVINEGNLRILKSQIDDKIQVLQQELDGYDAIFEYMDAYRKKNKEYLKNTNEFLKTLEEQAALLGDGDEELNERLRCDEKIRFMRAKADRFLVSDELCRQSLVAISQRINAHNMTINSLEMARDLFIPAVCSQIAIAKGTNTANDSLEVANTLINLFESLLIKNVEGTYKNMGMLKNVQVSNDLLIEINNRVNSYMSAFNAGTDGIDTGNLPLGSIGVNPDDNSGGIKKKMLTDGYNNKS